MLLLVPNIVAGPSTFEVRGQWVPKMSELEPSTIESQLVLRKPELGPPEPELSTFEVQRQQQVLNT